MPSCWFADLPGAGPCEGALVKCHLLTRQELKKLWRSYHHRAGQPEPRWPFKHRSLQALRDDPRCWVYGCGGPCGPGGHHGQFKPDGPRVIDRHRLPEGLEEFAAELGLTWWLERTYGPRRFTRGEDDHTSTVDGAAGHAGSMHRNPLTGLYY